MLSAGSEVERTRSAVYGCEEKNRDDPKQLVKKLELILGEVLAGNTSIELRNMGVAILDTLLKMLTVNRSQYDKMYKWYFNNLVYGKGNSIIQLLSQINTWQQT